MDLKCRFKIKSWDEKTLRELPPDRKITLASATMDLVEGDSVDDATGEVLQELVMYYRPDGTADVLGLLQITGSISGRTGGFALESIGGFDGTTASGQLRVIPGSGTDELSTVRGSGASSATHESYPYVDCMLTLDVE